MWTSILTSPLGFWLSTSGPGILALALLAAMAAAYFMIGPGKGMRFAALVLLAVGIGARVLLAAYQSVAQYVLWRSESFTALFLPPNQPWSYYLSYVGTRFWLPVALALLCAILWYAFLRVLGSRTDRYFDIGEVELATLAVFVAGWPLAIVLLPVAGVFLLGLAVIRQVVLGERYTTLGLPFLAATLVVLLAGRTLLGLAGWEIF